MELGQLKRTTPLGDSPYELVNQILEKVYKMTSRSNGLAPNKYGPFRSSFYWKFFLAEGINFQFKLENVSTIWTESIRSFDINLTITFETLKN